MSIYQTIFKGFPSKLLPQKIYLKNLFLKMTCSKNAFSKFLLKKFLIFLFTFLVCWERTFEAKTQKKNVSYTFPYTEARFSKLKYFLMIIIKQFFSLYNIFSKLSKLFVSIFWEIFVTFPTILMLFFVFFFRKFLIYFASFIVTFLFFLDNVLLIYFYIFLHIRKKKFKNNFIKKNYKK